MDSLVSTDWLASRLGSDDIVVLSASAHLPDAGRDAAADFAAAHIPGALRLDLSRLADADHPAPGMVPPPEQFAEVVGELGVSNSSRVVLYDDSAIHSAFRAWYLFRLFGHADVAVLDGGLAKWQAEGREIDSGAANASPRPFHASRNDGLLRLKAQIAANCETGMEQLVDARGSGRFTGEEPEIRPGMASGHIPGARNLPYSQLFREDGTMLPPDRLRAAFEEVGIDPAKPVVTTCGSGVSAAILFHALDQIGATDIALYDGSWSEWAMDPDTPKATGPA